MIATKRHVTTLVAACSTVDGAGVKLRRSIAEPAAIHSLDPFMLFHEFSSRDPADYLAGFPNHPHWGVESVTYMLDGTMHYSTVRGPSGVLRAGGVQWITAGRGVVHAEMPDAPSGGVMRGCHLWINLPALAKTCTPCYRILQAEDIPEVAIENHARIRVIAGEVAEVTGAVTGIAMDPLVLDVFLPAGAELAQHIELFHAAFFYSFEGNAVVGDPGVVVPTGHIGVLSYGSEVTIRAGQDPVRCLLAAARQLNEPAVRYGGFVMNTPEQIAMAVQDYHAGRY